MIASMNQWLDRCSSLHINNVYKQAQEEKLTEIQRGGKNCLSPLLVWADSHRLSHLLAVFLRRTKEHNPSQSHSNT